MTRLGIFSKLLVTNFIIKISLAKNLLHKSLTNMQSIGEQTLCSRGIRTWGHRMEGAAMAVCHLKADSHEMQRSAFSAVDCANAEIGNFKFSTTCNCVHCGKRRPFDEWRIKIFCFCFRAQHHFFSPPWRRKKNFWEFSWKFLRWKTRCSEEWIWVRS